MALICSTSTGLIIVLWKKCISSSASIIMLVTDVRIIDFLNAFIALYPINVIFESTMSLAVNLADRCDSSNTINTFQTKTGYVSSIAM